MCAGLLLLAAGPARACGHCLEDKVAATYDYGVVLRARADGHRVYVFELRGPVRPGDADLRRQVESAVAAVPGVDHGTVRVALDPPAVSCAGAPSERLELRVPRAAGARLSGGVGLRFLTFTDGATEAKDATARSAAATRAVAPRSSRRGSRARSD